MEKKDLAESLKKFNLLVEYNFYLPKEDKGVDEQDATTEEDPNASTDPNTPPVASEDPNTPTPTGDGSETTPTDLAAQGMSDVPPATNTSPTPPADQSAGSAGVDGTSGMPDSSTPMDSGGLPPMTDTEPIADASTGAEGDVEVDITDLVTSTKDTNDKLDGTNQFLNNILQKFGELEGKMSTIDQIVAKIDGIEHEVEKRLPTPVEKLELRSLDSFPYTIKLSDFWNQKNQEMGITNDTNPNEDDDTLTLTQDKVMSDYNPLSIKSSFDRRDPVDQNF